MTKLLGWMATILVVCLLVWQVAADVPLLPRLACALLLVTICGLAGLRIGANSAASYIQDVHRLNKVLAEQQRDLEDLNANLLKQLNAEVEAPAPSERS